MNPGKAGQVKWQQIDHVGRNVTELFRDVGDTAVVERAIFDACAYFASTNLTYDGTALHPLWADDDDAVAIFRNIVYRNPLFAPCLYVAISGKLNAIAKCSGVLQRKRG